MPAGKSATYPRVVELLSKRVSEIGQRAVARESEITHKAIQRYLGGESEPTFATLEKLAHYFNTTVSWLREESELPKELAYECASLSDEQLAVVIDFVKSLKEKLTQNVRDTLDNSKTW